MGTDEAQTHATVDLQLGYPEVFAGAEGQGAADAAYETAISIELSRLRGEDCTDP